MRYRQVLTEVVRRKPMAILEIGVWKGLRALEMLSLAPEGCIYYGFDLFEDANPETDAAEKNVKSHHKVADVRKLLAEYPVKLFKGNTRETLKDFHEKVDFVWLDGGHSVETIRSDWENVKRLLNPGAVVLFDDYYTGGIDTKLYGCNEIVNGLKHEVLPMADPVHGGGFVHIARVHGDDYDLQRVADSDRDLPSEK